MSASRWRQEFWVPGDGPYLLTHSVGCMLRDAAAAPGRNAVLVSEQCFPSMAFVLARAAGYRLHFLPNGALPGAELDNWTQALDADDVHA